MGLSFLVIHVIFSFSWAALLATLPLTLLTLTALLALATLLALAALLTLLKAPISSCEE